ncbi:unnamed protein product, partial [Coregonus sp. 'balchen']
VKGDVVRLAADRERPLLVVNTATPGLRVWWTKWVKSRRWSCLRIEAIVEVSGKYNTGDYIAYLVLHHQQGALSVGGQPTTSFKFDTATWAVR